MTEREMAVAGGSDGPGRLACEKMAWRSWLLLALVTVVVHGGSVFDAPFLDDHWHQSQLRSLGWSPADLLDVTTIEPDEFIDSWWQEGTVRWRYTRPASVLLMKVVHAVSGGSNAAHHVVSIFLHFLLACMIRQFCFLLTRNPWWSLVGGLLFVVYTHSIFTVQWLAAQNVLLQTNLMVAALLVYIRGTRLSVGPARPGDGIADNRSNNRWAIVLSAALFGAALLSRPNALMFPVVVVALDWAFGGWKRLRAGLGNYALFGSVALLYIVWRFVLVYEPIPSVYMRHGGDGYLLWCVAKLLHYLVCSIWLSPMTVGPTGRLHPFREVPGDCALMIAILVLMGVGYYFAARRVRGYWIWPLWILLSVLPVVPVLATPHSGYLPGVGFVIALVLGAGLGAPGLTIWWRRWRAAVAIFFLVAMCSYVPIYQATWDGTVAGEHFTIAELSQDDPPVEVTDLFFINLPFVNIYVQSCLEEIWGEAMDGVRSHVLTFAPDVMQMGRGCRLRQLDGHRFTLEAGEDAYFSGLLGRFLMEGMRENGPLIEAQTVSRELFSVDVDRIEDGGIRRLTFTFHRPLASPGYRFYLTTETVGSVRVSFADGARIDTCSAELEATPDGLYKVASLEAQLVEGDASAGGLLLSCIGSTLPDDRQACWDAFRQVGHRVALATACDEVEVLAATEPPSSVNSLRRWWCHRVDDRLLVRLSKDDAAAKHHLAVRDGLQRIRSITSQIIETDLYTTGAAFAGPYDRAAK